MNFHLRPYNQYILNIVTNIYLRLDFYKKIGNIPTDIMFLLEMYCHGSITMTVEWAISGMNKTPEEMADLLIQALPPKLEQLLSDL
ncbi:MAG TPA: TetR family transcriptional regulator C-terminal domain-containing protein [Candidatus Massiliomicrobiota merdigallinarum]|nr:TetR family transcriptional regulator C-terminal domain-containing protein [Candidatus Massilimicrobiota merdigallinarum]